MRIVLGATLALLLTAPARAAFEDLGAGARAPGLGDAFTALADDAYAIHYNPAGLAQLERPEFGASYSKLYTGLSDGSDLGSSQLVYAHPLAKGRHGALGFGWERFSLGGLYTEQSLAAAYGRGLWSNDDGARLMAGVSAKYLTHSFATPAEAANACDQGQCNRGADPVLSGANSKSVPDADLGLIYRFPQRFQAGLSVAHLTEPNVGFAGTDRLPRAVNLGAAYKSLWLSLIGEIKMRQAAAGGTARDAVFAAERYFPTLDYGQFGLRGSVGFGLSNSDRRQMTLGASYRINKIQFDYAFLIPVGGVSGQSGSHRFGLSFHFGAPTSDEELSRDLLGQAKALKQRGPDYGYEYSAELKPQDLADPRLVDVRRLIERRRYRLAAKALSDFAAGQPLSPGLIRLSNRLDLAAYYYAELPEPASSFDRALSGALGRFVEGSDRLAVLQASYAASLKPEDARLGHLLDDMEKALGLKGARPEIGSGRGFIENMLDQAEFANTRGEAARVESLLKDVLFLEPENATALERLGSLRYLAGRLTEAIAAWEAAAKLETRAREQESLREYLRLARDRSGAAPLPGAVDSAPSPSPTAPAQAAPEAPASAVPSPVAPAGDPRDVEKLYQSGVEHYARGEYLQASAMFLRILRIDPGNEQARKALERIDRRREKP
jgi:tetratricopeptide (TPR) repeat protein